MRRQIAGLYGLLIVFNVAAWAWAFAALGHSPALMGMALLAYSFGLRHALDADHIAAIDNVTRKMMHAGKRPLTIGLMFSLGHSSVVMVATAVIASTAAALSPRFALFKSIGGVVGTLVSTVFLFTVALTNLMVLLTLIRAFRRLRRGEAVASADGPTSIVATGWWGGLARFGFAMTTRPWHMYVLGFLFGLGFDTATEVSLLGLSASQAVHGMGIGSILVFPALFTAAMTLVDTTDGLLMLGAYGWAFVDPARKLYYNMAMTGVSVAVAVIVGAIEAVQLLAGMLDWRGEAARFIERLSDEFSLVGGLVVAIFLAMWAATVAAQRRRQPSLRPSPGERAG